MPSLKYTAILFFFDTLKAIGLPILFYGGFSQLSMMIALVISNGSYLLPTIGKCTWNALLLKNEACCSIQCRRIVLDVIAITLQTIAMIFLISLFTKTGEWNQWRLGVSLLIGFVFTILDWGKLALMVEKKSSVNVSGQHIPRSLNNSAFQSLMSMWRILLFCAGVVCISLNFGILNNWKELLVIFNGEKNVYNSPIVRKHYSSKR